ncbi:MAG: dihydromonapterin reductase [Oleiphilus sp.]|nr:MAG: dihydromonapterin reductase [Oleiphilus sp.]
MSDPVLITGVGKRLGLATAKHMIARGIPVIGTYRTLRPGVKELSDAGATLYPCDFYQEASLKGLVALLRDRHPALRALVHNASDWNPDEKDDTSTSVFCRMMQIHATVPYLLNRALKTQLARGAKPFADIIHISDYVASTGSKKHIAYAASKAALDNMTLSFAAAFGPEIKVNTIAPALMLFNPGDDDNYQSKALAKAVIQTEGGEEEFLRCIDYLLESTYITGQCLTLNGGRHLRN